MGQRLAIDFGTTNSVIAHWKREGEETEIIALPGLSDTSSSYHWSMLKMAKQAKSCAVSAYVTQA